MPIIWGRVSSTDQASAREVLDAYTDAIFRDTWRYVAMRGDEWRYVATRVAIGRDVAPEATETVRRAPLVSAYLRAFQVARAARRVTKNRLTKRSELAHTRGAWPMGEQPGPRAARVRGLLAPRFPCCS